MPGCRSMSGKYLFTVRPSGQTDNYKSQKNLASQIKPEETPPQLGWGRGGRLYS